jgi:activator of 2-hydroxyglutaryl-CoA dehydratase
MKALILTVCLFAVALGAAAQNNASPQVRYHMRLQNESSFESRMKSNVGFTVSSAKRALRSEREKQKAARRRERKAKKRDGIYQRINQFKTK